MQTKITFILLCFFCLSANAQTQSIWQHNNHYNGYNRHSEQQQTLWQHSLSANWQALATDPHLWGLRYESRLHTPHKWTDFAFGASSAFGKNAHEWSHSDKHQDAIYKSNTEQINWLTLHGYCLFGKKNWTIQTGLEIGFHKRTHQHLSVVTTKSTIQPIYTTINNRIGTGDVLTVLVPLGLRYQSQKSGIIAWATGGGGYYYYHETYNANRPFDAFIDYSSYQLQAGVGYTFSKHK